MIVPDVNLLVHAHDSRFHRHEAARAWWEALMNASGSIGLPWVATLGFIRISTNPRIFENPFDVGARAVVSGPGWPSRRRCSFIPAIGMPRSSSGSSRRRVPPAT